MCIGCPLYQLQNILSTCNENLPIENASIESLYIKNKINTASIFIMAFSF